MKLNDIGANEFSEFLNRFYIDNLIDDDGDIFIEKTNFNIYISFKKDMRSIRFSSSLRIPESIDVKNTDSYIKISKAMSRLSSYTGYGFFYFEMQRFYSIICNLNTHGEVSDEFLIKLLADMESKISFATNIIGDLDSFLEKTAIEDNI